MSMGMGMGMMAPGQQHAMMDMGAINTNGMGAEEGPRPRKRTMGDDDSELMFLEQQRTGIPTQPAYVSPRGTGDSMDT